MRRTKQTSNGSNLTWLSGCGVLSPCYQCSFTKFSLIYAIFCNHLIFSIIFFCVANSVCTQTNIPKKIKLQILNHNENFIVEHKIPTPEKKSVGIDCSSLYFSRVVTVIFATFSTYKQLVREPR